MKKGIFVAATILSSLLYAGGNVVAPIKPVAPIPAAESNNYYLGLGAAALSTYGHKLNWFKATSGQDRTAAIVGIVGYKFNNNFALEGRLSYGAITGDFSKSTNISIFIKPSYDINDKVSLYGLFGLGWVKIAGTNGYADIAKKVSPQLGLGASYKVKSNIDLFADYTWLLHNAKAKTTLPDGNTKVSHEAFTLGFLYHF